MSLRMTRRKTALAAAVIISLLTFTTAVSANHALQYTDAQTTSSGNWIWWRTGFDWFHPDAVHFRGYSANGGTPANPGSFDRVWASSWAGASCDNGVTFPWSGSGSKNVYNSTYVDVYSSSVFMPSCSSSPKYRSQSSHLWGDGLWGTSKSNTWNQ